MDSLRDLLLCPELLHQSGVLQLASQCGLVSPGAAPGGPMGVPPYQADTQSYLHASAVAEEAQEAADRVRNKLQGLAGPQPSFFADAGGVRAVEAEHDTDEEPITPEKEARRLRRAASMSDSATGGGQQPTPAGAAANSKGLRYFAVKVCDLVRSRGRTNYHAVGDELVKELGGAADTGGQHDDKNVRRRVYDAINVLKAMEIIVQVECKDLVWKGLPEGTVPDLVALRKEKEQMMRDNERMLANLEGLVKYQASLGRLIARNKSQCPEGLASHHQASPGSSGAGAQRHVPYPFALIKTSKGARVQPHPTEDLMRFRLNFHGAPFELLDGLQELCSVGAGGTGSATTSPGSPNGRAAAAAAAGDLECPPSSMQQQMHMQQQQYGSDLSDCSHMVMPPGSCSAPGFGQQQQQSQQQQQGPTPGVVQPQAKGSTAGASCVFGLQDRQVATMQTVDAAQRQLFGLLAGPGVGASPMPPHQQWQAVHQQQMALAQQQQQMAQQQQPALSPASSFGFAQREPVSSQGLLAAHLQAAHPHARQSHPQQQHAHFGNAATAATSAASRHGLSALPPSTQQQFCGTVPLMHHHH